MKSTLKLANFQLVAQLVAFPVGRVWARVVPNVKVFGHSLNMGPFTIKEHVRPYVRFFRETSALIPLRSWLR
jgi:hypothetical protein